MSKSLKITILLFAICYLLFASKALAQTMSNSQYIIQMGNLNSISGHPTGSGYALLYTAGQTSPGLYSGTNYKVRAGFEYILSIIPFRFTISNTFVDFGTISPTYPVFRTSQLTVSNGSTYGYQVTASQNHNLRDIGSGNEIPPTACDSGPCTTSSAGPWTSSLTYGFGYRCDNNNGTDCDSQFLPPTYSNYYRPFVSSPSAVMVMSGTNVGRNKQVTITYQVNVSRIQAAGLYTNVINYIATPKF
jgi:hypothetical protein